MYVQAGTRNNSLHGLVVIQYYNNMHRGILKINYYTIAIKSNLSR